MFTMIFKIFISADLAEFRIYDRERNTLVSII